MLLLNPRHCEFADEREPGCFSRIEVLLDSKEVS